LFLRGCIERFYSNVIPANLLIGPDLDRSLPAQLNFQRGYLAQTAEMAFSSAELAGEKRLNQVPGYGWPNGPATHTNDIHVVILHTLLRREMIVNEPGADAGDLVGTDGSADAAAADCDPAHYLARGYSTGKWNYDIGIVV